MPIQCYDRKTCSLVEEDVFEKSFMDIFYGTVLGRCVTRSVLCKKPFSQMYGWKQRQPGSARRIMPFVEKYNISVEELEKPVHKYETFNEFFSRKLKPSARPVNRQADVLISPADGRLMMYPLTEDLVVPVKGMNFTLGELLGNEELSRRWQGGCCVKIRLAPSDYHRFCYVDDGFHDSVIRIHGDLHSVSPLALQHHLKILHGNDREFVVFHSDNFGKLIHMDIGALVVGKIHQNFRQGGQVMKGEEKGYFEFGGSTIILLFEPGRIVLDEDIVKYSRMNIESMVSYGSAIGRKRSPV